MSFDPNGYVLRADEGMPVWFLETRMSVKAGGQQTGGAFTLLEWSAPAGSGRRCTATTASTRRLYLLELRTTLRALHGMGLSGDRTPCTA